MTRNEFVRALRKHFRRQHGYLNSLPEDADERLDAVEASLWFALPPVARFVYKYAGEDFISPEWSAKQYRRWCSDPKWPRRLVPLVEEGCGIWLCLDCSRRRVPVLKWRGDYATEGTDDLHFEHQSPSFVEWLRRQLPREGNSYE